MGASKETAHNGNMQGNRGYEDGCTNCQEPGKEDPGCHVPRDWHCREYVVQDDIHKKWMNEIDAKRGIRKHMGDGIAAWTPILSGPLAGKPEHKEDDSRAIEHHRWLQ